MLAITQILQICFIFKILLNFVCICCYVVTGNCFDFGNILCSLLLGAGYDAYVVSGYATKEICLSDETREMCPLLIQKEEVGIGRLMKCTFVCCLLHHHLAHGVVH